MFGDLPTMELASSATSIAFLLELKQNKTNTMRINYTRHRNPKKRTKSIGWVIFRVNDTESTTEKYVHVNCSFVLQGW